MNEKNRLHQTSIPADLPLEQLMVLFKGATENGSSVMLKGADPDRFHELALYFSRESYFCTGQPEQDHYHFSPLLKNKQRILVTATQDNFHFVQPVMRLMREQGHYVTTLSSDGLNQQTLLNALRHCDVAWFEWGDGAIIPASKLPKYCKIVCRMHRYELYNQSYMQADWQKVDEVIFVSEAMKNRFVTSMGDKLPSELKISVIANLTEHQPVITSTSHRHPYHIACVARFAPQKNLIMLLPVLQMLVKHEPRFKLFIAGRIEDTCLYDSFKELVSLYGLNDNVMICGTIASSEMAKWYSDKSFLLSVSYNEAHPMGIFEGMLAGLKPVVFHAPGGVSEYLPAEYLFINPDDAVKKIIVGNPDPTLYAIEASELLQKRAEPERYQQIWETNTQASFLFSVVIPCYNREKYLLPAVASALNQRDHHFEVIVVDDGSTDRSLQTIAHIDDPRLKIIRKQHTNAPDTRNYGIEHARGEYIVWLDSDDLLHSNALSHYRTLLQRWPQADVLSCGMEILGKNNQYFSLYNHPPKKWLNYLPQGNFISNPGCCVRRTLYKAVGNYNTTFLRAHDYEFWSRAAGVAKIAFTERCNIAYRLHENNLTGLGKPVDTLYEYLIFNAIIQRYRKEELFPGKTRQEIDEFITHRKSMLLEETGLDNTIIVLDAISLPLEQLPVFLQLLGSQDDRKFHVVIVSNKPLPFSGLPVLISGTLENTVLREYACNTYPGKHCRFFSLDQDVQNTPHLISDVKNALLNNTVLPAGVQRLSV
ncbi:glycosyltransferase [Enterobacter oligotrophicus]